MTGSLPPDIPGHEWDFLAEIAHRRLGNGWAWSEVSTTLAGDRLRATVRDIAHALGYRSTADLTAAHAHALRALKGEPPVFADIEARK